MLTWTVSAWAGLGPANVVVVYNADDPPSVEVAEAYGAARSLPPGHLCGIAGLDPLVDTVSFADFDALVRSPVEACIASLPQPEDIDAIVTVRGLPYVVTLDAFVVGLEAALQVGRGTLASGEPIAGSPQDVSLGFGAASVPNPDYVGLGVFCASADLAIDNPYGDWYRATCALQDDEKLPRSHRRSRAREFAGVDLSDELYVVTRLDGFDHDDALALVERGVAADGAFPTAPVTCMHGGDEARGARDPECELTVRLLSEAGVPADWIDPFDGALAGREVSVYFTGADNLVGAIDGQLYAPGAIACNLTSFGAVPQNFFCDATGAICPASESQTSVARFVRAGATGAHGTVAEPLNNSFPQAGAALLYTSGYSLGESFLFAQEFLYWQNLVLGDPLATPFAERPTVTVPAEVSVGEPLEVVASHPDGVAEVRLYLDGVLVHTEEGDTAVWEHGAVAGETLSLLAVAVAEDHVLPRPGWPVPEQQVRADTQGWSEASVAVTAGPVGETGDTGVGEGGGCGCDQGGSPLGVAALALAWLGRRRSG